MTKPMRVFLSPLTGRAYASNDYEDAPTLGLIVANTKHDVTDDVVRDLMAAAWARGWNECNAATEGEAPPNPYRPANPPTEDDMTPGLAETLPGAVTGGGGGE